MAFVSTLGASDANSYLSVAKATTRLGDLPSSNGIATWLGLDEESKEKTLVGATMAANPLKWKGRPATFEQSLAWPRVIRADYFNLPTDELPIDFEVAIAYLAAFIGSEGGYTGINDLDGGAKQLKNSQYDEVELGRSDLRVKFRDQVQQTGVAYITPFCMDIFARYMVGGGFNQPRLVRESTARIGNYAARAAFRPSNIRVVNGLVWPAEGGWASNPL